MALDIGGGRRAIPRVPSPHQPKAGTGSTYHTSYDPLNTGSRSVYQLPSFTGAPQPNAEFAYQPQAPMPQSYFGRMFQGAKDALNPANIIRQIREDPFAQSGHPLGIQNDAAEEAQRAMWESLKTPEGQGAALAGGATALLPFKTNFKLPKTPGQRVKDYPMMDSSRWRIKNRNMGEHYGFAGRFGDPEDRAAVQRQRSAPTIQEHLANLDAIEASRQGGVIPQGLRDLMNNSTEGNLRGMAQFGARQDRSVAPIHMRERVQAGDYPGLRNPPKRQPPTNKGKRLSAEEGNDLGRMLGELDEWGDPIDDVFPGSQHSLNFLSSRFTGEPASLVERQGINQARARGSFMDESRRFTPELLADMLGRSGMWRAK